MFDDALKWAEQFSLGLEGAKKAPTRDAWAEEFCRYWFRHLAFFAACVKHPSFKDEKEWRLIYDLDDLKRLKFRQRQSMMSRHVPLSLTRPLPITGVLVGPCRHPRLSQIAVSDLVVAVGEYAPNVVKVEITGVPYRTV